MGALDELVWIEEVSFKGDSACFCFAGKTKAHPVQGGSLTVDPPAVHVDLHSEETGRYTIVYDNKQIPTTGQPIKIRYAWRRPRLTEASVKVLLPSGEEVWASMSELREAINHGFKAP